MASGLEQVHSLEMFARVILEEHKFVNVEAPRAITDLKCTGCEASIKNILSFKCHNRAYAKPALPGVLQKMEIKSGTLTGSKYQ